eukprot:26519-Pyramimonas_sp.AAC.1
MGVRCGRGARGGPYGRRMEPHETIGRTRGWEAYDVGAALEEVRTAAGWNRARPSDGREAGKLTMWARRSRRSVRPPDGT